MKKAHAKTNLVKRQALLAMLERAIKKHQNNLLTTTEIIQHLIDLAKDITDVLLKWLLQGVVTCN